MNDLTSKIEEDSGKNKELQEKADKDINKRDRALTVSCCLINKQLQTM